MAKLQDSTLPFSDREALAKDLVGLAISAPITFQRITMTLESGLPEALRGGDTVIGQLPDGSNIAVVFPPSDSERLRALKKQARIWVKGEALKWDPFLDHLLVLMDT